MKLFRLLFTLLMVTALAWIGWQVYLRVGEVNEKPTRAKREARPAPVVTAPVELTTITLARSFNGTLEARAEFVAAPKVSGVVVELAVDLGDTVGRGQRVAKLDDAEFRQAVALAAAELKVAEANLSEARKLLAIADRELKRIDQLSARGVSSASQRDEAQAEQLAKQAHVEVTLAEVEAAAAKLESAKIRHGYTSVNADWHGEDAERIVAERYMDAGGTVGANTPLLKIVRLAPITAVLFVTERDYAGLHKGQAADLTTDAYPKRVFAGRVERIAPVFRESTRQARVEIRVDNPDLALKPGMFVRATIALATLDQATVVPFQALTRRDDQDGLFVLSEDRTRVAWRPVEVGIREGDRVAVDGDGLHGEVVILGQQLLDDDSPVLLPEAAGRP